MNLRFFSCTLTAVLLLCSLPGNSTPIWSPEPIGTVSHYDAIKLTSGEWLKGNLRTFYNNKIEFKSAQFGTLIIDIDNVVELYSNTPLRIRLHNGDELVGHIQIKNQTLTIDTERGREQHKLTHLLAIASATTNERDYWQGEISFGTNFRRGNSSQSDFTLAGEAKRRTATTRFTTNFVSHISERIAPDADKKERTTNDQRINASADWFFSPKTFVRLAEYDYFADQFGNIDHRHTIGFGVGHDVTSRNDFSWEMSVGPSFQSTRYISVSPGQQRSETSGVLNVGTIINWELTRDIAFDLDYQIKLVSKDAGKYIHRLKTGLYIDLNKDFNLDLTFYLDRIEHPKPTDIAIPNKNDYRFVISLGYKF